jgi:hypothetical protein
VGRKTARCASRIVPFLLVPATDRATISRVERQVLVTCLAACLALTAGCSSDDYQLERKGGPVPNGPVQDPTAGAGGGGSASNDAGAGGEAGADPIAFCKAFVVVQNKCQRCHGDPLANGAPVAFLKQEDFQAQYYDTEFRWWEISVGMVERDKMPFVALNGPPTNLQPPVEGLTVDEKATLVGWLKQGALPEGGTQCQ